MVLSKIDCTEAFGQIGLQCAGVPVFGYGFRVWVVTPSVAFGYRSSPVCFCLHSAALELSYCHTTNGDAVVIQEGKTPRRSMSVKPPRATCHHLPLSRRFCFFVRYYVDKVLVDVHCWSDGRRCRRARAPLVSDHFRHIGTESHGSPILLSSHRISSWHIVLCVLGYNIDTVAIATSVPKPSWSYSVPC